MTILQSRIDPNSETFRANRRDMLALVEGFRALEARVRDTSNQKLPMFQKRGQLTPSPASGASHRPRLAVPGARRRWPA